KAAKRSLGGLGREGSEVRHPVGKDAGAVEVALPGVQQTNQFSAEIEFAAQEFQNVVHTGDHRLEVEEESRTGPRLFSRAVSDLVDAVYFDGYAREYDAGQLAALGARHQQSVAQAVDQVLQDHRPHRVEHHVDVRYVCEFTQGILGKFLVQLVQLGQNRAANTAAGVQTRDIFLHLTEQRVGPALLA